MKLRLFASFLLVSLAANLAGCSGKSARPATFPVHGVVTYQGKPVEGAGLTFIAPGAPRYAMGKTDAVGMFSLTTFEPDDGAVAGSHTVVVMKRLRQTADVVAPQAGPDGKAKPVNIDQAMAQQAQIAINAAKAGSALPQKYSDESTTDLHFEVVEGENNFNINLSD